MEEKRGYIKGLSESECAVDKNKQLWDLYETWLEILRNKKIAIPVEYVERHKKWFTFNAPQLLTCSDSYCESSNKVMMIGKEANTGGLSFCKALEIGLHGIKYQEEAYYNYDREIAAFKADKRDYLKTRMLLSGIDYNTAIKLTLYDVSKVITNNLNKSSYGGNFTDREKEHKKLYIDFEYNNVNANIFIHELNILRPTHIVLACGYGYDEHIKNSLGEEVYETVEGYRILSSYESISKYSENLEIYLSKINLTVKTIHVPHPSAPMCTDARNAYNELLKSFIR